MIEQWKPIKGFEDIYQVSNFGNVKALNYNHTRKEKRLKIQKNKDGYRVVCLYKKENGKDVKFQVKVARLVAQHFIPNPNNLPQVNHIDETRDNDNVANLEWCTSEYNLNYGSRRKKAIQSKKKYINQYDLDGTFIAQWHGAKTIEKVLGFADTNIARCCKGKYKKAYGYIWRYADEVKEVKE